MIWSFAFEPSLYSVFSVQNQLSRVLKIEFNLSCHFVQPTTYHPHSCIIRIILLVNFSPFTTDQFGQKSVFDMQVLLLLLTQFNQF